MALKFLSRNFFKDLIVNNAKRLPISANLHTSAIALKKVREDRKEMMKTFIPRDEGTQGESTVNIDGLIAQ